ncbi:MAG TPA: biotin/lipoyl-binding protein, partial [Allocoleopsis sp.]
MKEIKDKYQQLIQKPPLRLALIIAVLGSLATLGMGLYQLMQIQQNNKPIPVVTPTISPIKYVSALGRLEPEGEVVKVSASGNNAKVQELLVKEGAQIEKGQIIAILDTQKRLQANVEKAKQQIKVAQANLA